MLYKKGKLKVWDGEQVDYHVGSEEPMHENDFQSPCSECGKTVYHFDMTNSSSHIHIKCLTKVLKSEEK